MVFFESTSTLPTPSAGGFCRLKSDPGNGMWCEQTALPSVVQQVIRGNIAMSSPSADSVIVEWLRSFVIEADREHVSVTKPLVAETMLTRKGVTPHKCLELAGTVLHERGGR